MYGKSIGQLLREYRTFARLKQDAVAESLNVSQGFVSKIESDLVVPSDEIATRIHQMIADFSDNETVRRFCAAVESSPHKNCLIELTPATRIVAMSQSCRDLILNPESCETKLSEHRGELEKLAKNSLENPREPSFVLRWQLQRDGEEKNLKSVVTPIRFCPFCIYLYVGTKVEN
ncbi:helix-turn-helix domain-containing protein [Hyphobacterium sp.]|uniref:helix-turn-helix domain-containing protein n=1 Tax=Hyphobacterium sp. TaxID=2004662 RepID=UPI003B52E21C